MAEIAIENGRTGTYRLWNNVISQYYGFDNRPVFETRSDGTSVAEVSADCADDLARTFPNMERVDEDADSEPDDDESGEDTSGDGGDESSSGDEYTAEDTAESDGGSSDTESGSGSVSDPDTTEG